MKLLPMIASTAHKEGKIDEIEQKAERTERDPEETAEYDAK